MTKCFGDVKAVDDLSFSVDPGLITGFLGPNGAGKTTTLRMLLGLVALVGVGLGALVRDQVATVVGLLIYLFVVEQVLISIPPLGSWTMYLPGAAANALTQADQDYLAPWQGGLVLAGYGLAFVAAGTLLSMRRDVT